MKLHAKNIEENMAIIDQYFSIKDSFDIVKQTLTVGNKKGCLYFIDGFTKDEVLQKLMQYFMGFKPEDFSDNIKDVADKLVPYGEVNITQELNDIEFSLLSGITLFLIDGYSSVLTIDCRTYPARGVEEPEKDRVLRGSRDGFVETLVFNTALIRRRIRHPYLTMEIFSIGKTSKTDVVISYFKSRVDDNMLKNIRKRLQEIDIDALTMNQESLAECLFHKRWINPFPKFKYTERPDTAAASILEGNIVILVDNSPAAIVLPSSIFDIIEEADDYYFPPVTGTYLRCSRMLTNLVALLLTPTFLLLMNHPQWVPPQFSFISFQETLHVPAFIQFLLLEFAIDGLRLAAVNTPNMLSTPLSVVAGIVLGDFTVSSGWFNAECMLYMAFVAIATYSQASFELGYALKFMRIILLFCVQIFGLYGYIGGIIFVITLVICNKTLAGKSYIYPLFPFNWRNFARRFLRVSLPASENKNH